MIITGKSVGLSVTAVVAGKYVAMTFNSRVDKVRSELIVPSLTAEAPTRVI